MNNMNDLEMIFNAQTKKAQIDKDTYKELTKKAKLRIREIKKNAKEKLSFLSKYGCKVYITEPFGYLYIDYSVKNGNGRANKRAEIKVPTDYNGKYLSCKFDGKFYVNWDSNVCHNYKDSILALDEIVSSLASKINR